MVGDTLTLRDPLKRLLARLALQDDTAARLDTLAGNQLFSADDIATLRKLADLLEPALVPP